MKHLLYLAAAAIVSSGFAAILMALKDARLTPSRMLRARGAFDDGVLPERYLAGEIRLRSWAGSLLILDTFAMLGLMVVVFPVERPLSELGFYSLSCFTAMAAICTTFAIAGASCTLRGSLRKSVREWIEPLNSIPGACTQLNTWVSENPELSLLPNQPRPLVMMDFVIARDGVAQVEALKAAYQNAGFAEAQLAADRKACAELHSRLGAT